MSGGLPRVPQSWPFNEFVTWCADLQVVKRKKKIARAELHLIRPVLASPGPNYASRGSIHDPGRSAASRPAPPQRHITAELPPRIRLPVAAVLLDPAGAIPAQLHIPSSALLLTPGRPRPVMALYLGSASSNPNGPQGGPSPRPRRQSPSSRLQHPGWADVRLTPTGPVPLPRPGLCCAAPRHTFPQRHVPRPISALRAG